MSKDLTSRSLGVEMRKRFLARICESVPSIHVTLSPGWIPLQATRLLQWMHVKKINTQYLIGKICYRDSPLLGWGLFLSNERSQLEITKIGQIYDLCFGNRIVNIWNSLPSYVVSAETVNCFKTRLDRFWLNQDIIYNSRSEIHGTGSWSEITVKSLFE